MSRLISVVDQAIAFWFSWMVSMTWQVAGLVAILAVIGYLLQNRSARFRYSLWTLVPIRLLLPPSLALMTSWAWWLLPYQPPANRASDANSKMSAPLLQSTAFEIQRSEDTSSHIDPQNSAPRAMGELRTSNTSGSSITGIDGQLELNNSSFAASGIMDATSGLSSELPDSFDATRPTGTVSLRSVRNFAFGCWLAIVCLLSSRLMIGYRRVHRWVTDSVPADEGTQSILKNCCQQLKLHTLLSVRISPAVWTPLVTGLFRPVILLPPAVLQALTPRELEAVLIHELQHVIRRDFAQECLLILMQVAYFFHPCVWIANRQLRRLREQACDETTIAILNGQRSEYGSGFVKVAELLMKPMPQLTLGIVDSDEQAASRLRRILDPKLQFGRGVSWSSLILIVLLGLILVPSAARQSAIAETKQESAPVVSPEPVVQATPGPAAGNPKQDGAGEIATIGKDDVEPFELKGQVLGMNSNPASKAVLRLSGYTGYATPWSLSMTADEEGRFRIRARLKKERLPDVKVTAISSDNLQIAYYRFPWNQDNSTPSDSLKIQLGAARAVRLKVVDKAGQPVDKARAALQLDYPNTTEPIPTGADGIAQIFIPAGERILAAASWKDHVGLDYRLYQLSRTQIADATAKAPEFPQSGMETLILDGVSPVSVKVVDDDGVPMKNVSVAPWLLTKSSQNEDLNLSYFHETFGQYTNDEGITNFAWMPSWQTQMIQFWPYAEGYDRQRGLLTPGKDGTRLVITLKKLVPIRGHVRDINGVPASGINVSAVGAGHTHDRGQGGAVTDKDGAYEFLVSPNQIYLVTASAKGLASNAQTGFAVFKGKPVEKDFVVRKATRIYGKLVDEESQEPIAGKSVIVYQFGQALDTMKDVVLPNPEKANFLVQPITQYWTKSDANGRFELFVGDGNFDIRPPQQEKSEKFQIDGEFERGFIVETKLGQQVELVGTVKDKSTDLALAGATIFGVSRNSGGRNWQATTNEAGEFRVRLFPAGTYVHAISADKRLGAIMEVAAKQPSVALALQSVGTARGRLLLHDTKEPWGAQTVSFGITVPFENQQTFTQAFGGRVTTATDGTFELTGLVPGWKYQIQMDSRKDGTIPSLGQIQVQPGEAVQIGDVSPPPPPKPDVPPTLE